MWPVSLTEILTDDSHTHTKILIYNTTNLDFHKHTGQAEQFWEFLFGKYHREEEDTCICGQEISSSLRGPIIHYCIHISLQVDHIQIRWYMSHLPLFIDVHSL